MRYIKSVLYILVLCLNIVYSLYQDEVGINDWHIKNLGKSQHITFSTKEDGFPVVLSETGYIGMYNNTGELVWRSNHLLDSKVIEFKVEKEVIVIHSIKNSRDYISIINLEGQLIFYYQIPKQKNKGKESLLIKFINDNLILLINEKVLLNLQLGVHKPVWKYVEEKNNILDMFEFQDSLFLLNNSFQYTKLNKTDGSIIEQNTLSIDEQQKEVQFIILNQKLYLIYLINKDNKIMLNLYDVITNNKHITRLNVEQYNQVNFKVKGKELIVSFNNNQFNLKLLLNEDGLITNEQLISSNNNNQLLINDKQWYLIGFNEQQIQINNSTSTVNKDIEGIIDIELYGTIESMHAQFKDNKLYLFIVTKDATIHYFETNDFKEWKLLFKKQEGLSTIQKVVILNLPNNNQYTKSDKDELSHFNIQHNNLISSFINRLLFNFQQLINYKYTNKDIIKDKIGKQKLIIGYNKYNQLFCINTIKKGQIEWQSKIQYKIQDILILREANVKLPPIIGLIVKDKYNIKVMRYNALTGQPLNNNNLLNEEVISEQQDYKLLNSNLMESKELSNVLLFIQFNNNKVKTIPNTIEAQQAINNNKQNIHFYHIQNNTISGYKINNGINCNNIWSLHFNEEKIINVQTKSNNKMSSIGRIMNDRKVMFKYLNNNLITIITKTTQNHIKLYIIDTIIGKIIYQVIHKEVNPKYNEVKVIMDENKIIYHFLSTNINDEYPDAFVTIILEMFQDKESDVRTINGDIISNYNLEFPSISSRAFVHDYNVSTLAVTNTLNGITDKEVLFGYSYQQSIHSISYHELDARRPYTKDNHQETSIPYSPIIKMQDKKVLSYNLNVIINHIISLPTSFESTNIIIAYGHDLFFASYAPYNQFDLLSQSFSKSGLIITIVALIIAVIITRPMVMDKKLNLVWI